MEKQKAILKTVTAWLEAHKEYKKMYNKKMAFDFNFINFFKVGENKVSEILAYFLNPNEKHGQGNVFLKEFLEFLISMKIIDLNKTIEDLDINNVKVITEKVINKDPQSDKIGRIDIFLEFNNYVIAIENKLWAKDQPNQLSDYSTFLAKKKKENFILFYLTPYKKKPSSDSIKNNEWEELEKKGNIALLGYTDEVFKILDRWIGVCEADNVAYFLKQLKQYMRRHFLGNETFLISKQMENLVLQNQEEVEVLIKTYESIKNKLIQMIEDISKSKELKTIIENNKNKLQLFDFDGKKVCKVILSKGDNEIITIRVYQEKINVHISYSLGEKNDEDFNEKVRESALIEHEKLEYGMTTQDIINKFKVQIEVANKLLKELK
ncbi:MAG TPA: hypothetical protein DCQ26_00405 [Marinilabiliales bacterium]|nr:MAG: hypothetical protein A2W95_08365 [Bacteroidetes bacterium GWA2_40_14]OFX75213.1 MAG: hypothetical protein A2W96_16575 [Bacteroidetes bacterium GWD2_40_43]OFX89810.1 MAG: hypothetical protein A2W97_12235 [Bacteroidetes bacterium GWE2_40_63]OFY21997.1 MAG: hypothetical protein A2W88_00610 [Bacteroidetes bacterium GWF2_40_13]OFZ26108.1 MAG: hypothetical protein A2437_10560 [Bacteroidetes bacterium RIFOXYC2_FULL_40_12]HAM97049.1 hypothetical protein [Marinilabiliales bacterium]